MLTLRSKCTRRRIGGLSEDQLQFLFDHFGKKGDQSFTVLRSQVQAFKQGHIDPALVAMLEKSLGDCDSTEVVWERT